MHAQTYIHPHAQSYIQNNSIYLMNECEPKTLEIEPCGRVGEVCSFSRDTRTHNYIYTHTKLYKYNNYTYYVYKSMNECEPRILEIELCGGVCEVAPRLVEVAVGTADLVGGP